MDLESYIYSHGRPCLEWGLLEEREGEDGILASRKGFTQRPVQLQHFFIFLF